MKFIPFLNTILSVSVVFAAPGSKVTRQAGEEPKKFIMRVTGFEIEEQQLGETGKLNTGAGTILGFTRNTTGSDQSEYNINLNVLRLNGTHEYTWSQAEVCEVEGGSPSVRAYFYANVDASPDLEVGVICGWDAPHAFDSSDDSCAMTDEVRFFKVSDQGEISPIKDQALKDLLYTRKKVAPKTVECSYQNFKTTSDVKALLKKRKTAP